MWGFRHSDWSISIHLCTKYAQMDIGIYICYVGLSSNMVLVFRACFVHMRDMNVVIFKLRARNLFFDGLSLKQYNIEG